MKHGNLSVASAEKGLLGKQKGDVRVELKQSARSHKKKILRDQVVSCKQAEELLEANLVQPIAP